MKVTFLAPEKYEYDEAVEHYEEQQQGLGERFRVEVIRSLKRVANFSNAYVQFSENTRRCLVAKFQHSIVYHFDRDNEEIIVIAIAHTRRKPEYWRTRVTQT